MFAHCSEFFFIFQKTRHNVNRELLSSWQKTRNYSFSVFATGAFVLVETKTNNLAMQGGIVA